MKEGWEKKKIKDVCYKGSSNIVLSKVEDNTGDYPLYGASGFVKNIDFFHNDKPYIGIVKDGSGVGRVNVYPAFSSLVGTLQYIFPKDSCYLDYLAYCLKSLDLSKFVNGAAIPHIYFKDYGECVIPVPPLSVQESIVSELDMLSSIISKHKALQEEYDRLEQSIFYDMFGDPVTNEKGWDVKKLGEVCEITSSKRIFANEYVDKGIPFYRSKEIAELGDNKPISVELFIDKNKFEDIRKKFDIPHKNDILIAAIGATIGKMWIVNSTSDFYFKDGNIIWLKNKGFCPIYIKNILNLKIQSLKEQITNGGAYPALTIVTLKEMEINYPPLSIQQSFADKISAIEQMKAKNKAAQEEAEMLFNERMAYYF